MATVRRKVDLEVSADVAWAALRRFGDAHRIFAGVLVDCRVDGNVRTVTFSNGRTVKERLITLDDQARRLVYTVLDGPFTQHSASIEVLPQGEGSCLVWTSDFLPEQATEMVAQLSDAGCAAVRHSLSGGRKTAA